MQRIKRLFSYMFSHRLLVWSPLLFLVPVYILTYYNILGMRKAFREQNELALTSAAQRVSERIDNFIKTNREAIGTEAQIPSLVDVLKSRLSATEGRNILSSLAAKNEIYVTSYAILNTAGKNVVDTNQTFAGRDESKTSYFQVPSRMNRVFAGGLRFDKDGGSYVVFAAPIRDRAGNVLGVLRSQYSSAVLQMLTASGFGLMGRGSYGVLVSRDSGLVLGHGRQPELVFSRTMVLDKNIQKGLQDTSELPLQELGEDMTWMQSLANPSNGKGYGTVTPTEDFELLGASVDLDYSNWRMVYLQPAQTLRVAFQEQLFSVLLLALITAMLVLGLSLGVSQLLQRLKQREVDLVKANQKVNVSLFREQQFNMSMARDLELGRSVQKSLHQLPRLPSNIDVVVHHEAAKYVSGDTFFVHWNRPEHTVAIILNDVTGHGVQAALKASACQQIARSVWSAGMGNIGKLIGQKLEDYDQHVEDFLASIKDSIPDFNAMVGAEIDLHTGRLAMFRANYNFPVVISPKVEEDTFKEWSIDARVINNRDVQFQELQPGSFVVLMSDGFIDQSRHQHQIMKTLRKELKLVGPQLSAEKIRRVLLQWDNQAEHVLDDDKTFIVLHWRGVFDNHLLTG